MSVKSVGEFHRGLRSRGVGARDWSNTWTEHEYLGTDEQGRHRFGVNISIGHRVFKDKEDGKWKKHKVKDERPAKDYVLVQSAKCCVEIYPYYAKYFDVHHEEVRLYEERWVVQRLFKEPDTWRDVGAWNPIMVVEDGANFIRVTVTYDTDYGIMTVEYLQRDGSALKHNVTFTNESNESDTFRVLQRWAGIVGAKCNGKDVPLTIEDTKEASFLRFHRADKLAGEFSIAENLWSMIFNPDGSEKTECCLQRPVSVEAHAQGMKADFIYSRWVLAQDESLTIDPDTYTNSDPTVDGSNKWSPCYLYTGDDQIDILSIGWNGTTTHYRGYVEWDITGIPDDAIITLVEFWYHGKENNVNITPRIIGPDVTKKPSDGVCLDVRDWLSAAATIYIAYSAVFPEVGTGKSIDLGAQAITDLTAFLDDDWFAIGMPHNYPSPPEPPDTTWADRIYAEEHAGVNPAPTLYVEYTVPVVGGGGAGAVVMGTKSLILDLLLEGVI